MAVSIEGLNSAAVLAALYNNSRPQGMGFLHYDNAPMGEEEAAKLLSEHTYFDYLKGRVMKVKIEGNWFDEGLYDRDNGAGAARRVIDELRKTADVFPESSQVAHREQTRVAAELAQEAINQHSGAAQEEDGMITFRLGLSDMADVLAPIVDEVLNESDAPDTEGNTES